MTVTIKSNARIHFFDMLSKNMHICISLTYITIHIQACIYTNKMKINLCLTFSLLYLLKMHYIF